MNFKLSGENLRLLRLTKGAKQCSIAKKLGISQPAYSKYEKRDCLDEEKASKPCSDLMKKATILFHLIGLVNS